MIKLKMAELRSRIWKCAGLSAVGAAIPVPGVPVVLDLGIIIHEAMFYFKQLGLDRTSLQRYATLYLVDYDELQSIVRRTLGFRIAGEVTSESIKSILLTLLPRLLPVAAAAAAEEAARFLPLIGGLIAAPLSFGGTYLSLKTILDKFEKPALEVMKFAAGRVGEADEVYW